MTPKAPHIQGKSCVRMVAFYTFSLLTATCNSLPGAEPGDNGNYVTRDEYEKLKEETEQMRQELKTLKQQQHQSAAADDGQAQENAKEIQEIRDDLARLRPGVNQFVLAGDASFGFTAQRENASSFDAQLSPLILWRPADKLLIETAIDFGLNTDPSANSSTSVDLAIADASYEVTDWLTVGGGLFIVPFGQYHNHFDPPWINKFPDDPLPFGANPIAPNHELGAFARGALPVANTTVTYDAYVANGPNLIVNDSNAAGTLNFDDFTDLNDNKAIGGRIGLLPVPQLEVGYSVQFSKASPAGFPGVYALLQAVDFNYQRQVYVLQGTVDLRAQWVWSNVQRATYDANGRLGFGPLTFSNDRQGGYAQFSYRPTLVENHILRNLEFAFRFDMLNSSLSAPGGDHEKRWTIGIDYWLAPNAVLKTAYEIDDRTSSPNQNAFLIQFGVGL